MMFDKVLFFLLSSIYVINVGYTIVAPFYPLEYEKKGVSTSFLGLTIAMFAFVITFTGPFFGAKLG